MFSLSYHVAAASLDLRSLLCTICMTIGLANLAAYRKTYCFHAVPQPGAIDVILPAQTIIKYKPKV